MGLPPLPPENPVSSHASGEVAQESPRERRRLLAGWTAGTPAWMQRVSLVVFVVFCIELGILLTVLPWTRVWTENSLLVGYPAIQSFVQQGFVRGIMTGIGLLDIWIGVWEAVHYTEVK